MPHTNLPVPLGQISQDEDPTYFLDQPEYGASRTPDARAPCPCGTPTARAPPASPWSPTSQELSRSFVNLCICQRTSSQEEFPITSMSSSSSSVQGFQTPMRASTAGISPGAQSFDSSPLFAPGSARVSPAGRHARASPGCFFFTTSEKRRSGKLKTWTTQQTYSTSGDVEETRRAGTDLPAGGRPAPSAYFTNTVERRGCRPERLEHLCAEQRDRGASSMGCSCDVSLNTFRLDDPDGEEHGIDDAPASPPPAPQLGSLVEYAESRAATLAGGDSKRRRQHESPVCFSPLSLRSSPIGSPLPAWASPPFSGAGGAPVDDHGCWYGCLRPDAAEGLGAAALAAEVGTPNIEGVELDDDSQMFDSIFELMDNQRIWQMRGFTPAAAVAAAWIAPPPPPPPPPRVALAAPARIGWRLSETGLGCAMEDLRERAEYVALTPRDLINALRIRIPTNKSLVTGDSWYQLRPDNPDKPAKMCVPGWHLFGEGGWPLPGGSLEGVQRPGGPSETSHSEEDGPTTTISYTRWRWNDKLDPLSRVEARFYTLIEATREMSGFRVLVVEKSRPKVGKVSKANQR